MAARVPRYKFEPITVREPHKYDVKTFSDPDEFTAYYRQHEEDFKNVAQKKKFEEILGSLVIKPQGKPTLVPITDKRAPLNTAKDDFKEENENE